MPARVFLIGLAAALLIAASASAEDPAKPPASPSRDEVMEYVPRTMRHEPEPGHFRWGIPESPFPLMEAERKLVGFHLEFQFGGGDQPRRGLLR